MLKTDRAEDIGVLAVAATVPISGRFDAEMALPQPGQFVLGLRVDVDSAVDNSPVMNRMSGGTHSQWRHQGR